MRWFLSALSVGAWAPGRPAPAQDYSPPPPITADGGNSSVNLAARADKLESALTNAGAGRACATRPLPTSRFHHKAAEWIRRHNEFYQKEAVDWTREALDRGLLRANQAATGEVAVDDREADMRWFRGYRSRVDESVQALCGCLSRSSTAAIRANAGASTSSCNGRQTRD